MGKERQSRGWLDKYRMPKGERIVGIKKGEAKFKEIVGEKR